MNEKIFCVDGNWYLHRAFLTLRTNQPVELVLPYHLFNMIIKDALAIRAWYILVAFDGPAIFRYKIYPHYKSSRRETKLQAQEDAQIPKVDIYSYLPSIYELFEKIGLIYFQPKEYEADDVLCSVAKKYSQKYAIICGTVDKDAYQYLNDRVQLYDPTHKGLDGKPKPRYITAEIAEKKKGVLIEQMVDYQTLLGDSGDDIPAIKGMTPSKVKNILKAHGSLANWVKNEDAAFMASQKLALRRNGLLVTLKDDILPPSVPKEWKLQKKKYTDKYLSKNFYNYLDFLYPKAIGLF